MDVKNKGIGTMLIEEGGKPFASGGATEIAVHDNPVFFQERVHD